MYLGKGTNAVENPVQLGGQKSLNYIYILIKSSEKINKTHKRESYIIRTAQRYTAQAMCGGRKKIYCLEANLRH
jgi:hypothetical protein